METKTINTGIIDNAIKEIILTKGSRTSKYKVILDKAFSKEYDDVNGLTNELLIAQSLEISEGIVKRAIQLYNAKKIDAYGRFLSRAKRRVKTKGGDN